MEGVFSDPLWWSAWCGAMILPSLASLVLTRRAWQMRRPRVALAGWIGAFVLGCALATLALARVVLGAVQLDPGSAPGASLVLTILAWVGLGLVGAGCALVWGAAEPLNLSQSNDLSRLVATVTRRWTHGPYTIVEFDSPELLAFTGRPRSREVYLSSGLRRTLTVTELHAVIEHELVHLRQRHGLIVRLAEINAACLPRPLRAGREFKRSALFLVELIADDAAARRVGPARYANTLLAMTRASGDPTFELRARRLERQRFRSSRVRSAARLLFAS